MFSFIPSKDKLKQEHKAKANGSNSLKRFMKTKKGKNHLKDLNQELYI